MRKIIALTFAVVMTMSAAASTIAQAEENVATVFAGSSKYQIGEAVEITGSGWKAYEVVSVKLEKRREGVVIGEVTFFAQAAADGKIANSEFALTDGDVDVYCLLTAQGGTSNRTAVTAFTD